ncbi:MAG: zf-HC2 domain-containing protein [Actinobacteria bacterium]|nr:zf-HC2 domain-containing protein [Actinomycetota bacterium]
MSPPASWPEGSHPAEALSALADGELAGGERATVAAHVQGCPECTEELRAVRAVRDALRALPPVEPPAGLLDRLVADLAGRGGPRRRPALIGTAMAAAAALVVVLVPSVAGFDRYRPQVEQAMVRHVASVSALAAVGATTADGGPNPLVLPEPVTPSTAPPREPGDLPAPYLAPPELAGGYRLVDAFAHPDGVQVVYERGRYGLSVFESPGELDPEGLEGGQPVRDDDPTWRWHAEGVAGRVVVLERGGVVVTAVGDEPGDAVLSAARSVPEARPLSLVQRLRRAAALALRALSASSGPPPPPAGA